MKKWILGTSALALLLLSISWWRSGSSGSKPGQSLTLVRKEQSSIRLSLSRFLGTKETNTEVSGESSSEGNLLSVAGADYFNDIVSDPKTNRLFAKTIDLLGESRASVGAAMWMTMGIRLDSSKSYGQSLNSSLQQANSDPKGVYRAVQESIPRIRQDPFIYQMTLNLLSKLEIGKKDKAEFFGREIETQLLSLNSDQPSSSFWVASLGLHLAKEGGVGSREIAPFLQRGAMGLRTNPKVLGEFLRSAEFYFPGLNLKTN